MIKLQTAVVILGISLVQSAYSATTTREISSPFSSAECSASAETMIKLCDGGPAAKKEACKEKIEPWLRDCVKQSKSGSCTDAEKEYGKALTDFRSACQAAQIPMSRTTGHMACSAELKKCIELDGETKSNEPAKALLPGMRDLERESSRMDQCALLATTDQEKMEKQIDKARERKRDLDNKIPDIQDKMAEAQEQADKNAQELANKQQENAKEYAQQMKESKRNMEAVQKQLGQQVAALQEQLDALDQQVGQIEMSMTDAEAKYQENITQIELSCHASASQEVAKLQEDRLEKMKTNSFNRGGFSDMLKKVGVSDRESWQRLAAQRYQWCMESKPTRDQKKTALRAKELTVLAAQNALASVQKRKVALRQQMAQIKDQNGCGGATQNPDGSTNETEMCKALRNAFEDQQQTAQEFQMKQQNVLQQQQMTALTAQRKQSMYAQQLQKASMEINDEQTRLRNLEEFLALKQQKAGGSTTADARDSAKARDGYGSFFEAAQNYASACCKDNMTKKGPKCSDATTFIDTNGGDSKAFTVSGETSDVITPDRPIAPESRPVEDPPAAPKPHPVTPGSAGGSPPTPGAQ